MPTRADLDSVKARSYEGRDSRGPKKEKKTAVFKSAVDLRADVGPSSDSKKNKKNNTSSGEINGKEC